MANLNLCSVPECGKTRASRGFCQKHYYRWRTHGDPAIVQSERRPFGEAKSYLENVLVNTEIADCIPWPYSRDRGGYGLVRMNGKRFAVHRYLCERFNGPAPSDRHQASHDCGKGHEGCCNPHHVSWKTPAENQADRIIHGTTSRGEAHGASKLTMKQARFIKANKGVLTATSIAGMFGVSRVAVSDIIHGRNWAWLD